MRRAVASRGAALVEVEAAPRRLRRTVESIVTPCSVKA
jgi:hypothetical protein